MDGQYKIIDTSSNNYNIVRGTYFNSFSAGDELKMLFEKYSPNTIKFEEIAKRTGRYPRSESLFKCNFTIPGCSKNSFYIYVCPMEGGGRPAIYDDEARIQFNKHSDWSPDLKSSQIAKSFVESSDLQQKECYLFGIYKPSENSDDDIVCGFYPSMISDFELEGTSSKSMQTKITSIQEAYLHNVSLYKKTDSNIVVSFKPNLIFWYMKNRDELHLGDIEKAMNDLSNKVQEHALLPISVLDNDMLTHLIAIRTKPFLLLAGVSGTGKSRIVRKLAQGAVTEDLQRKYDKEYTGTDFKQDRWDLHSPANFELIQVKPNWHNSMDVVGYLSNIPEPHYVFTPFIEFIAKAWKHLDVPFFLCLDEMNLAPVEEYFAEFLSAIESRSFENGVYKTDPIIKSFNSFKEIGDDMINTLFPDYKASDTNGELGQIVTRINESGMTLPPNLIVIGTVNMDETTFSFSRKVLDRAMSIEMNEVDYSSFLTGQTDDKIKALVEHLEKENGENVLNNLLVDRHIEAKEVIGGLGGNKKDGLAKRVLNYLDDINSLLEGTPFKLGYRAANEALIYLQSAIDFDNDDFVSAMDNFTLMKILSRIEGDETKLSITDSANDTERLNKASVDKQKAQEHGNLTVLTALREIISQHLGETCLVEKESEEDNAEEGTEESTEQSESKPNDKSTEKLNSIKKIDSMISQLERDHFVTYWN